jgi:hypothetical protein
MNRSSRSRAGLEMEEPIRRIRLASVVKRLAAPVVLYYMFIRLSFSYSEDPNLELDTFTHRSCSE